MTAFDGDEVVEVPEIAAPTVGEGVQAEPALGEPSAETGTENGTGLEQTADPADDQPLPVAPIAKPPVLQQPVYGRYRGSWQGFVVELRVDCDGRRPLNRISGDYFQVRGGTTSYYGSFQVDALKVTRTAAQITLEGAGKFTWDNPAKLVRVTIPRISWPATLRPASLMMLVAPKTPGETILCEFVSRHFRTVSLEQDSVAGTVPFVSYDTGSLTQPASSPARTLTVSSAYAEAGIELLVGGSPNVVPVAAAGKEVTPT